MLHVLICVCVCVCQEHHSFDSFSVFFFFFPFPSCLHLYLCWHASDSSGNVTGEAFSRGPCEVHLLPGAGRWRRVCRLLPEGTDGPAEGRLLGAIRRTVGEHLASRGYWVLTALLDRRIRQHVINLIISPGIVSLDATAPSSLLQYADQRLFPLVPLNHYYFFLLFQLPLRGCTPLMLGRLSNI